MNTRTKDGQVFDHYPRALRIYWVESGMFENTYQIQVHYRYREGHWNEDYYEGTSFTFGIILHSFVGKNEGRCRVRAINEDGIAGEWSEWGSFRFTR